MAERTIEEIKADYQDCQCCEDKSCLGLVSNCPKDGSIVTREAAESAQKEKEKLLERLKELEEHHEAD